MKLQEALGRIVDVNGAWRVAFDHMDDDGDVVVPDHFPDVEDGEDPFDHEELAMQMRDKFAAANIVHMTNVRCQQSTDGKTWNDYGPVRNVVVPPTTEDGTPLVPPAEVAPEPLGNTLS